MATRRVLSTLLHSSARRRPAAPSALVPPRATISRPSPVGLLLSRAAEYATAAAAAAPAPPAKVPDGPGGKITDEFTGAGSIGQVPVGRATLGRIINVIGEAIDHRGDIKTSHYLPIHRWSFGRVWGPDLLGVPEICKWAVEYQVPFL